MEKKKIILIILFFVFLLALLAGGWFWFHEKKRPVNSEAIFPTDLEEKNPSVEIDTFPALPGTVGEKPPPPPVSMMRLKMQGCVADGLLTEYSPEHEKFVELVNRSNCYYLHRAIETWREPPNFKKISRVMDAISKKDVVYGMFIAEAISTKKNYKNDDTGRYFRFRKMCHRDSMNHWGEHTCKPTFSSDEYREYIKYTTRKAMDLGVQSFTFGQIYMQESSARNYAPRVVKDIRAYAKKKGIDVVIGAQTGSNTDQKYLGHFDYIEGGVGIDGNGNIESGPCLTRKGSCWGLLWHQDFSASAKNVLLHLDWTGIKQDDLDIFARMSPEKRAETLRRLYTTFTAKDMGFLLPFFGVLDPENGGCYGPKKRYYSPDNSYACRDEDVINSLMKR